MILGDVTGASNCPILINTWEKLNINDLIDNKKYKINAESFPFFLQTGLIPFPFSPYEEMITLGIGDTFETATLNHSIDFPYFNEKSEENTTANYDAYLALLAQSIKEKISNKKTILMLSSGKDSVTLALAISRISDANITCVTYTTNDVELDESLYAQQLCKQLGLNHKIVQLKDSIANLPELLQIFFKETIFPIADPAIIPYLLCLHEYSKIDNFDYVLDGMGNDIYMGHIPSKNDLKKNILAYGQKYIKRLQSLISYDSILNFLFNTRAQNTFPGRLFREKEIKTIFEYSISVDEFWAKQSNQYGHLDLLNFRALIRGRHYDQNVGMLKGRLACALFNSKCIFPFTDERIINFYFNLREEDRFNRDKLINKVFLRNLLKDKIAYDDKKIGKKIFAFEGNQFIELYKDLILKEIYSCTLWKKKGLDKIVHQVYKKNQNRKYAWNALFNLFMLSGWLNHSRYIDRNNEN